MKLVILIPLVMMILSDYRTRTVVLWQLLLFGATIMIISLAENGLKSTCMNLTINMLFSVFTGLGVYLYFLLKYKSVQSVIGKGDILFILFLTPFFAPREFLIFMLVSFVATLFMWIIAASIRRDNNIPLISGVGICLCALLIYKHFM
jgi:Type IV leader peptidase family.